MLIDWFTVLAQVINFLVLVWLLKRFLYHPILKAIDTREKQIAAKLADADEKESEAEQQRDDFQQKNAALDKEKFALMVQVEADVKAERTRLLDAARMESEELQCKLQSALKNEQISLRESLGNRVREEVFEMARKTLSDLSGITLEARMIEVFIDRLGELGDEEKAGMKSAFLATEHALKKSKPPLTVRTAFVLSDEQRTLIESIVSKLLNGAVKIEFVTESTLVSGIELNANGQKLAWTIGDYLASMAKSVDQLLETSAMKEQGSEQSVEQKAEQVSHENST